jgi:phosphoglycolate phosphatase-like HAD superfamily hydrolase
VSLPEPAAPVEVIKQKQPEVQPKLAFFDFDGTVSLVRAGWMEIMIRQSLDALRATGTSECEAELRPVVEEFIFRLTGQPTICQMMELAENVRKRGGVALEPAQYKQQFLEELREASDRRILDLRDGDRPPDIHMVPGTRAVLEDLQRRGVRLYLVSGTDDALVQEEARLFDVARYFDGGVYGSPGDDANFSKRGFVGQVMAKGEVKGPEMIGFGDGHAEVEAVKDVGGLAVGLATREPACDRVDEWKRERLIESGADYIIPNFLCWDDLKEHLFAE